MSEPRAHLPPTSSGAPAPTQGTPVRPRWLPEGLWFALCLVPLLFSLPNELQEIDPTQYAEVARRIAGTGRWMSHFADAFGPFLNKPPVVLWLEAVCIRLLGATSAAARLPTLGLGLVLLWAVAFIGRELWSRRTGVIAAALVGNSLAFHLMVADPKVDMAVSCFIALAIAALVAARRRPARVWAGWVAVALGILSKGPIGLVAPVVAVLPEALRRPWVGGLPSSPAPSPPLWKRLFAFRPLRGVALVAALMLPWYRGVYEEFGAGGPAFLLWGQSFGRVLQTSEYRNDTTPLFFLHTALWAFLPFSPVLGWALWRKLATLVRVRAFPPDPSRVVGWWLWVPFVALSFASYKLPQYLYWLTPPAALLSARAIEQGLPRALRRVFPLVGGVGVAAVAGMLLWALPPEHPATLLAWVAVAVCLAGGVPLLARRWPSAERTTTWVLASTAALTTFFSLYLHPALLAYQPDREWGALARQHDPQGNVLPFAGGAAATNASAYYANRDVWQLSFEELVRVVKEGRAKVAVLPPSALGELSAYGLVAEPLATLPSFPTSRPSRRFLDHRTRPEEVRPLVMVKVSLKP